MSVPTAAPREWTRAHVVTPFINALQGMVAVVIAMYAGFMQDSERSGEAPLLLILTLGILVGGLIVVGIAFLAWRVNEYRIGDDAVYQRKGILFKQQRQARLDRLQAVDVVQPLFARVFGFAEARIEVAGGRASTVSIKFLKVEEAEVLRNEVLALASGYRGAAEERAEPEDGVASRSETRAAAVAAPDRPVYDVPLGRLIGSIFVSWTFVAVVFFVLLVGSSMTWLAEVDSTASNAGTGGSALVAVLSVAAILWAQLNANAGFRAGIAADGIRLSHGLLDTRRQTVPPGRVQALNIKQSLLWRKLDWWKITLNVAGYQDQREAVSTLLPVGPKQQALDALWLVLPDLGDPDPTGTISTAMVGVGTDNGFTASPSRSWIFDPFQWRRRGVRATERALLIRRGLFVHEFFVIPHERTQSLAIRQGPLQRWLRLATIEVHSTRGVVRPVAGHLDLDDAIALVEDQARRAREGRKRQTPEQWMEAVSR
ncbi:MAG: PH domain-containing protein [Demequinaceae bacterium]|nr:PH domain-containing protein [Demequinaceae bacterium]